MDGAKLVTDIGDPVKGGRQAFCEGKILFVRRVEPRRNENPGGSRIFSE